MHKAIIVDIDGTIADMKHRLHYLEDKNWDGFYSEVGKDTFRKDIWDKVLETAGDPAPFGHTIIFVTGRPAKTCSDTMAWMRENGIEIDDYHQLYMRVDDDHSPDTDYKTGVYEGSIKPNYDVIAVFEDRPRLVRMYKEMGLNVIDCGDGVDF